MPLWPPMLPRPPEPAWGLLSIPSLPGPPEHPSLTSNAPNYKAKNHSQFKGTLHTSQTEKTNNIQNMRVDKMILESATCV